MFELLTRKKNRRSGYKRNQPGSIEVDNNTSNDEIISDSFKNRCSYNGNSLVKFSLNLLSALAKEKEISQGGFFIVSKDEDKQVLRFLSGYATPDQRNIINILDIGEGIPGQVAKDGSLINLSDIPKGSFTITSGLGESSPASLIVFPVKFNEEVIAVIELASFHNFNTSDEKFFTEISLMIAEQVMQLSKKY